MAPPDVRDSSTIDLRRVAVRGRREHIGRAGTRLQREPPLVLAELRDLTYQGSLTKHLQLLLELSDFGSIVRKLKMANKVKSDTGTRTNELLGVHPVCMKCNGCASSEVRLAPKIGEGRF